jgi:hypothetical protein
MAGALKRTPLTIARSLMSALVFGVDVFQL